MPTDVSVPLRQARHIRANDIDIHYIEAGVGEPLLFASGGVVSTNPIWTPAPISYASHMSTLAEHFHVIAPDTRGAGRPHIPTA